MLNLIRRTTAYLLACVMLVSLLPVGYARAAETAETEPEASKLSGGEEETVEEMISLPSQPEEPESLESQPEEPESPESQPEEPEIPESQPEEPEIPESRPEEPEVPESQPKEPEVPESRPEEPEVPESQPEEPEVPESQPEEPEVPESQPEEPAAQETLPEEICYQEEIPDDFVAPFSKGSGMYSHSFAQKDLPVSYDSRESGVITPIRNQKSWQLCWAFSAMAVGESYLLSRGQGSMDLSERHLGYFFDGDAVDPLGNADGDGTYLTDHYLNSGNNNKFTTFALANWVGGAEETKYPYDTDPAQIENTSALDDVVHLSNAYWINAGDTDSIKNYIMRNGSVGISIYYQDRFFNQQTAAYYNDAYTATNHAITIVGWDDNYSPDNFVTRPEAAGAWLCKNSHGTDFGEDGYFWVSYQDMSVSNASATAFVFEFESGNNYDWNYHHDGSYGTGTKTLRNGGSIANIYTASGSSDGMDEEIRAVGFAVADADLTYSIQIYRDLADPMDPTSGIPALAQEQTGQTRLCGYYSIPLAEPVTVCSGESFSVVVTLNSRQLSDIRYFADRSYTNGAWVRFVSSTGTGCSFVKGSSGTWTDLASEEAVARIKAYTVQVESRSISQLYFSTMELLMSPGESFFQEPGKLPEDANPCRYRWHSSQEQVAAVAEDGTVTAMSCGDAVITATTPDGRVSASYRVTVKPKLNSINLRRIKREMAVGEVFNVIVELLPDSAASYYTVEMESSDPSVLSVSGQTLHAHLPGTAVITVWAYPYYREYAVTVVRPLEDAQVIVEPAVYNGSELEPAVTVMLNDAQLTENQHYTLVYTDNILPFAGTVTVTGIGEYSGTIRQNFPIVLPETRIHSLKNESKGIRITWESCSGMTGYYVYRQKNSGSWQKVKTLSGKSSWLDEEASASGAGYTYKIIPYLSAGKKIYKAADSPEATLHRLLPPQISAVKLLEQGMEISWKRVSGADAYRILRSTPDTTEELVATVQGGSTLRWQDDSAVQTGLHYTYRITAQRAGDDFVSLSPVSQPYTACRPSAPEGFTAVNTAKGIRLSWEVVPHATGYEIQRSTNGSKWSTVKSLTGSSCSWTNTSCTAGSGYYYRVRALVKLNGTTFRGDFSENTRIYRLSRPSVTKISSAADGFKLSWKRITGADGYRIHRRCDAEDWEMIATVDGGRVLSYTDQTASQRGKIYTYSVTAWKNVGEQQYLSEGSAEKAAIHPEIPKTLTAVNSAKGIRLSWEAVPHATGYEIQRSTSGSKWSTVKTLTGSSCSWTNTSCTAGSGYYYRVRALVKLNGTTFRGDFSENTRIYRLSRPSVTKISSAADGFKLSWKRITGADGYRIYRSCDAEDWKLIATVDGGRVLSYTDQTASQRGKIYTYSVTAWKRVGEQLHLSEGSAGKSAIHPEIPEGLIHVKLSKGIRLSWKAVPYATGYEIQRSSNGIKWTTAKTITGSSCSWTNSSPTGYYYRIRALSKLNGTTFRSEFSEAVDRRK